MKAARRGLWAKPGDAISSCAAWPREDRFSDLGVKQPVVVARGNPDPSSFWSAMKPRTMMSNCTSGNPSRRNHRGGIDSGLARFHSRPGMTETLRTHLRILAARFRPSCARAGVSRKKRAQEKPDASTHPQPRVRKQERTRASVTTGLPDTIRLFLHDWF